MKMKHYIFYFLLKLYLYNCFTENPKYVFCGMDLCNTEGGICSKFNECICYPGYLTLTQNYQIENEKDNGLFSHVKCNYKQTSSFKAGLIEMIFGCGFGHFYAERTNFGTFKFLCVSIFCSCGCFFLYMIRKIRLEAQAEDHPYVSILFFLSIIFKITLVLWQLIDGILFFLKVYNDGNNVPLY